MATIEDLRDLIDPLGARRGVPRGRPEVDVPEPGGDLVDGDAGLEKVGSPVGPERVRMRQPLGHPSGVAVATHEPVHGDGREGERLFAAVAAEAHEQRLLVEQPDPTGERMRC